MNGLFHRAAGFPGQGLRIVDRAENAAWSSWAGIRERALGVCGALQATGIRRGDRVALVFPTGFDFSDAFFGILLAGGVPVPLYPPVRLGRLDEYHQRTAQMIRLAGARLVLADRRVKRILGQAIRRARPELGCLTPDELGAAPGNPVTVGPDELALIQFSSGTTVDPKPVALSHGSVVVQAELLNRYWPADNGDEPSGVSWLPLYHDMGLVGCIFPALERPAPLTLIPPEAFVARPAIWLRTISRYRATVSPAPNFAYGLAVEKILDSQMEGVDLSCWKVALDGAEAVVPSVMRAFQSRFARWGLRPEALTPVYGLSEAALAVTFSSPGRVFRSGSFRRDALSGEGRAVEMPGGLEIASVGTPLPGFHLRVLDEAGREVGEGRVGRVHVSGPSLMEGYLDQPEATARVLRDGWLDTGDLGFLRDGELYLTGRAKDLLILRGKNHAPEEVERALDGLDGVRTGCSVAVSWLPEDAGGEVLLVFVEARRGLEEKAHPALARSCAREVLSATGLLAQEVVVLAAGTLPRTSSGKLRRQQTLRLHLAGELRPPQPVTAWRLAGAVARSTMAYTRMRWDERGPAAD